MSMPVESLDTTEDAAKRLKVKEPTLRRWRRLDPTPIPFIRVGRAIRYRPVDVEAFIEQHREGAK